MQRPIAGLLCALLMTAPVAWGDDAAAACHQLIIDYADFIDHEEPEAFANLFTPDGALTLPSGSAQGRAAILEDARGRVGRVVMRHVMSNVKVDVVDDDSARATSYVTVYIAGPSEGPAVVPGPRLIGEYHDEFVRTADGWKISARALEVVYTVQVDAGGDQ